MSSFVFLLKILWLLFQCFFVFFIFVNLFISIISSFFGECQTGQKNHVAKGFFSDLVSTLRVSILRGRRETEDFLSIIHYSVNSRKVLKSIEKELIPSLIPVYDTEKQKETGLFIDGPPPVITKKEMIQNHSELLASGAVKTDSDKIQKIFDYYYSLYAKNVKNFLHPLYREDKRDSSLNYFDMLYEFKGGGYMTMIENLRIVDASLSDMQQYLRKIEDQSNSLNVLREEMNILRMEMRGLNLEDMMDNMRDLNYLFIEETEIIENWFLRQKLN